MAMMNNLNMVELLKQGLEKEVKSAVLEKVLKEQMAVIEAELREKIKPIVESIAFKGIESMKDAMRLRDELHVFLHWKGEISDSDKII